MSKGEKIEFITKWKLTNKDVLDNDGLREPKLGAVPLKNLQWNFIFNIGCT